MSSDWSSVRQRGAPTAVRPSERPSGRSATSGLIREVNAEVNAEGHPGTAGVSSDSNAVRNRGGSARLMPLAVRPALAVGLFALLVGCGYPTLADAGRAERFAWSENSGWLNLQGQRLSGGLKAYVDHLEGFVWHENLGWIHLGSPDDFRAGAYANDATGGYGVNRDPLTGLLSGYAWSENAGWLNFGAVGGEALIDRATGRLIGDVWAENLGWIRLAGVAGDAASYGGASLRLRPRLITGPGGQAWLAALGEAVFAGQQVRIDLMPDAGYRVNEQVAGDCPQGRWSEGAEGPTWVTGPLTDDCEVAFRFSRQPVAARCGSAAGRPSLRAPDNALCETGLPSPVVSEAGTHRWRCFGQTDDAERACAAPGASISETAGTVTLALVDGGCTLNWAALEAAPAGGPAGVAMPFGMMSFRLVECDAASAELRTTYSDRIDQYRFWKLIDGAWLLMTEGVKIEPQSATLKIADNGPYDLNRKLGEISDPSGPGRRYSEVLPRATLSHLALLLLAAMLVAGVGLLIHRRRR